MISFPKHTQFIKNRSPLFFKGSWVLLLFVFMNSNKVNAQEINFGDYSSLYAVTLTDLFPSEDLEFGMVFQNEGLKSKTILDAKVLSIEGVKYLDVLVDITADDYLLLDGNLACLSDPSCRIPFTLEGSYANRGANDTNQATQMTVAANIASAQFPVLYRGTNPPGPPPTPVYQGYNPALYNETAYLYIYGSLNIGMIDAGTYTADITITISYD
tara:strand:+ start:3646 stop:4287 length:642 start_codon:yes stop_codon:yes gene_type:complete